MRSLLSLFFLIWCFSPLESFGKSPDDDIGYAVAKSVANLARMGQIIDIQPIARELKLPDLERDITWLGPFARYSPPDFRAFYNPTTSELGIVSVGVDWKFSSKGIFNSLSIHINPNPCPSIETIEAGMGSKVRSMSVPGLHGGPSYIINSFSFPQSHGKPISVFFNDVACELSATYWREL